MPKRTHPASRKGHFENDDMCFQMSPLVSLLLRAKQETDPKCGARRAPETAKTQGHHECRPLSTCQRQFKRHNCADKSSWIGSLPSDVSIVLDIVPMANDLDHVWQPVFSYAQSHRFLGRIDHGFEESRRQRVERPVAASADARVSFHGVMGIDCGCFMMRSCDVLPGIQDAHRWVRHRFALRLHGVNGMHRAG